MATWATAITTCKECGSTDLAWQTFYVAPGPVQNGRLSVHEVQCQFVLGCGYCSETLAVRNADEVANLLNVQRGK